MDDVGRARARSFGKVAELYDQARPRYHDGVVTTLVERLGRGAHLLDVGCGTGILTVALGTAGFAVLGIEPDEAMAAIARLRCQHLLAVRIDEGTFESWVPDADGAGKVDGIVAGQSWHWVDPQVGPAKAAALLRPGGLLALVWNHPRPEANSLLRELEAAYERQAPELAATTIALRWTAVDASIGSTDAGEFDDLEVRTWDWEQRYDAASFTDLLRTHSDHLLLDDVAREALLADVTATIEGAGGSFSYGYRTRLVLAVRRQA